MYYMMDRLCRELNACGTRAQRLIKTVRQASRCVLCLAQARGRTAGFEPLQHVTKVCGPVARAPSCFRHGSSVSVW